MPKASSAAVALACTRDVAANARAAAKAAAGAARDIAPALSGGGDWARGLSLDVGCLCCVLALGCKSSVIPGEVDRLTDQGVTLRRGQAYHCRGGRALLGEADTYTAVVSDVFVFLDTDLARSDFAGWSQHIRCMPQIEATVFACPHGHQFEWRISVSHRI